MEEKDTIVTVVVVNWNSRRYIQPCLDSIFSQCYRKFDVIVMDNGSTDGSFDHINSLGFQLDLISLPGNYGFSIANNIALREVKSRYVALLNNDAEAHPAWLQFLVDALENHPDAGFSASKMLIYDRPDLIDRVGDAYSMAGTGTLRGRGEPARSYSQKEWIFGACAGAALYRTDMLRKIGLFDEDFFLLYEDVDLSFRAQLQGYKCIYVPEAVVYHKGSATIVHDSPISVYYSHRNLEWVYLKNLPASLFIPTLIPHMLYDLFAFIFFLIRGRIREFLKAKIDALKGIGIMLEKRRNIQGNRKVSDRYIWDLLEPEFFLPRLTRRLSKTPRPRRSDK